MVNERFNNLLRYINCNIVLLYNLLPYILLPYILLPYNACHCSDFLGHHKNDLPVGLAHTDTAEPAEIVN